MRRLLGKRSPAADISMLAGFSVLTGAATGATVTVYNLLVGIGEELSVKLYGEIFARPYFIPLLLAALLLASIVVGTVVRFVPMARGSGVPQAEGAARGMFRLKWFSTLCTTFAASLAAIFLGMSAGAEGPSVLIGGCLGEGIGRTSKRERRDEAMLVAAGASAGLATAFNAPLTGILFSVEEANRKCTPAVAISAVCSVVTALAVRGGLRTLVHLIDPSVVPFAPTFSAYDLTALRSFPEVMAALGISVVAGGVTALAGVAFYHAVLGMKHIFAGITPAGGAMRMAVPFLLAGAFGMISPFAMNGGHALIEALGTHGGETGMSVALRVGSPVVLAAAVILIMKFVATACNMGAGVPCGAFVPMLATGACIGALFSSALTATGMSAAYSDIAVMVCVAAFFSAVVKAPITSAVMVFELTGSYNIALLIPVAAASAVAYLVSSALRTHSVYDALLVGFVFADTRRKKTIVQG